MASPRHHFNRNDRVRRSLSKYVGRVPNVGDKNVRQRNSVEIKRRENNYGFRYSTHRQGVRSVQKKSVRER